MSRAVARDQTNSRRTSFLERNATVLKHFAEATVGAINKENFSPRGIRTTVRGFRRVPSATDSCYSAGLFRRAAPDRYRTLPAVPARSVRKC